MNQPTHFIIQYSHTPEYLHLDIQHDYFSRCSSTTQLEYLTGLIEREPTVFKVVAIFKISLKDQI